MSINHQKPKIFCSLNVYFPNEEFERAITSFETMGVHHCGFNGRYWEGKQSISLGEIYYREYWELGDALTDLFNQIPVEFDRFCQTIVNHHGNTVIDIAFEAYDVFPVLVLEGEVMKKIRKLQADIDIDPYYTG